jgi:hypothetical protein
VSLSILCNLGASASSDVVEFGAHLLREMLL